MAEAEQAGGLVGGFDEGDGVGEVGRLGVLTVGVVLTERGVGSDAVAQKGACGVDYVGYGGGHSFTSVGPDSRYCNS
jgi:hypothetical protein